LSADTRKVPLAVEVAADFGTVRVELIEFKSAGSTVQEVQGVQEFRQPATKSR
jgi:hypothetical protein